MDYLRLNQAGNTNFEGIGGRIGFNVAPRVQLEGQMTYDFQKSFSSISNSTLNVTVQNSNLTLWHGLFGPKFTIAGDHASFFGTVQGGFIRFGVAAGSEATASRIASAISAIHPLTAPCTPGSAVRSSGGLSESVWTSATLSIGITAHRIICPLR